MNLKLDDNVLLCPHCGGNNMHHTIVAVFSRGEDADDTVITTVDHLSPSTETVASSKARNPSSRRDGMRVQFWCENGCDNSYLTISQHKGCTFVEWEN